MSDAKKRKAEYQKNLPKGIRNEYQNKYRRANPEKINAAQLKYRDSLHGSATAIRNHARRRAKEKNLECTITKEWVIERIKKGECQLTKIKFDMTRTTMGKRRPYSPSIDRIDNSKGYTADNCRVVLSAVNVALNEWGEELFFIISTAYLQNRKCDE